MVILNLLYMGQEIRRLRERDYLNLYQKVWVQKEGQVKDERNVA